MNHAQEDELINEAILLARTVREELPAIRATLNQISHRLASVADELERANVREAS